MIHPYFYQKKNGLFRPFQTSSYSRQFNDCFVFNLSRMLGRCNSLFYMTRKKGTDLFRGDWGRYVVSLIMLWVLAFKIPFPSSYSI